MRNWVFLKILIVSAAVTTAFCACKDEPVKKSRFGQIDALEDGALLLDGSDVSDEEGKATSDSMIKTSRQLDAESLPIGVQKMVDLCDAINMTCVEMARPYTQEDTQFMWHCVHIFVSSCNDKEMGFRNVGDYAEADPEVIRDVFFAMFGKIREIPDLAEDIAGSDEGRPHIVIGNNLKYRFSLGDRGLSEPEVRRVTQYSDGSMEMEVGLVDSETREEIVCFIYSMRANTRDTTTSARYDYEITGSRSADTLTSEKMSGNPYLVPVMQIYGDGSYPEEDPKNNEVIEILSYNSFMEHVPGLEELNGRISKELIEYADTEDEEGCWKEICAYPLTTSEYVQEAVSVASCPNDGDDPDIYCYNYDLKKNRSMDKNDALALCSRQEGEITSQITQFWDAPEEVQGITYRGFIIRRDGSADLFYMLDIKDANGSMHKKMIAYNSLNGSMRKVFEGDGVIPADEVDETRPALTHGRKD